VKVIAGDQLVIAVEWTGAPKINNSNNNNNRKPLSSQKTCGRISTTNGQIISRK
jgi:hypothetical protein